MLMVLLAIGLMGLVMVVGYHVYFAYNMFVLVPRNGFRLIWHPFTKKIWKVELVNGNEEDDPRWKAAYDEGFKANCEAAFEDGKKAALAETYTVDDLLTDLIQEQDYGLVTNVASFVDHRS